MDVMIPGGAKTVDWLLLGLPFPQKSFVAARFALLAIISASKTHVIDYVFWTRHAASSDTQAYDENPCEEGAGPS